MNRLLHLPAWQPTRNMAKIGFIGLGNMGAPMDINLLKAGHRLNVFDISKKVCRDLQEKGATTCTDVAELVRNSEYVISMLPNSSTVKTVYEEISKDDLKENITFIDCSTISPDLVRQLQEKLAKKGIRFIEAPVSGGVPAAERATLTFMVGASKEDFKKSVNTLKCMGKRIIHCGDHGMAQTAKLCNNMMLAISMIGVSESMNLAINQGLSPKLFAEILNSSTGCSWTSEFYNPVPGISATTQMHKVPISLINKVWIWLSAWPRILTQ
ncbi:probable 3-hydroxyisobutyrate dehydrogenase, mitochondrial [Drosophila bipectinata]|uniref:probable 3-hydroxyisobutyrate dehydrogenase, mitochondrial n=1 Tax=Drosophila bipectinata TaxID=42026 RepID=UPI0038B2DD13